MLTWFVASHLISRFAGGGLLKLFLGNLMGDLKAVVAFLKAHSIWLTVSIVLASCWGVDHVISHRHAAKVESQLSKCTKGRADDHAAYVKAQTDVDYAQHDKPRILFLDIETKPALVYTFGIRDQHIGHKQIAQDGGVICVGVKWAGDRRTKVYSDWEHGHAGMLRPSTRCFRGRRRSDL
jgi:hypothetical protein